MLNNHREKQIINVHIYYGLKSISVMLLVTRHVGASLINLEETLYDLTRKAILNFWGSNILFSSLLWICFFLCMCESSYSNFAVSIRLMAAKQLFSGCLSTWEFCQLVCLVSMYAVSSPFWTGQFWNTIVGKFDVFQIN